MSVFLIDDAASDEIRRIFGRSNCRDPVAEIIGIGYPDIGVRTIQVLARERSDVPNRCLCQVSGIAFVREPVEALSGFCLTFDGERLLLRGPDNQLHITLQSALDANSGGQCIRIRTAAEAIEAAKWAWAEFYEKTHAAGFGKDDWTKFEPYSATLTDGIWILTGTVPADCPGLTCLTTVRAADGVVSVRRNQ
jgi:hypothetical protein